MPPEDPKDKIREAVAEEQRLTRIETKLDTVIEFLKPDGPLVKRIETNEGEIKNMQRGAVATIVTMFLGVISFIGVWIWNKVTGQN